MSVTTPKQLDLVEHLGGEPRQRKSHIFKLAANEHYVEETWCDTRLFEEESFQGSIFDPCCGFGRIVDAANRAGYSSSGSDIVDRSGGRFLVQDFFDVTDEYVDNIVMNPPFKQGRAFIEHALTIAEHKVAAILPVRRLNAMGKWIANTPLYRIWLMTPRPSMPPGPYVAAGKKVGGGTQDFCWLVWLQGFTGRATVEWLHRDGRRE